MDFSKEISSLDKERSGLVAQIVKLNDQLSRADEVVRTREDELATDTLQERATDSQLDALAREKLKRSAIEQAIAQGKKRRDEIDTRLQEVRGLMAWESFNKGAQEARARLIGAVSDLYQVAAELRSIEDLINGLNASHAGISMEQDDNNRTTQNVLRMLLRDAKPIDVLLAQVESASKDIANQARAKRKQ